MTIKEYETAINMLMAQGRKLYAVKLMKDTSDKQLGLKECKEHMDIVWDLFKNHLMVFDMKNFPTIYTYAFKKTMQKIPFNIENLHFFNTNGELTVVYR